MDKQWYKSKTIWGGLIAVIASIAGIDIGYSEATEIVDKVDSLVAIGGGLLAIYGRARVGK